jgi:hypothetical protein
MARAKASFWSRSLEKVKGAFVHAEPEQPQQRPAKKKPEARAATAKESTALAQDAGAAPKPEDDKSAGKKIPAQPWYRHRQRW